MPITILCTSCSGQFAVRDELAGKRIRCVKCQAVVTVPQATGESVPVRKPVPASDPTAAVKPAAVVKPAATIKSGDAVDGQNVRPTGSAVPVARVIRATAVTEDARRASELVRSDSPPPSTKSVEQPKGRALPAVEIVEAVPAVIKDQAGPVRKIAVKPDSPPESSVRLTGSYEDIKKKIMGAFEFDEIDLVPIPLSYRFGILLVAFVMLLMPVLYAALIGVVGWTVFYHATNHMSMISAAGASTSGRNSGRAIVFAILLYLAPIFAGGILILFMLKPFFSRPASDGGRRSLKPDDEPLLFEFVDRICDAVRAPRPRRIDIDCNVNASASFGEGMLSLFGNNLVLTIGMPLVAGLELRQFAGVLAHEFGHFAQGAGMRLTYIIRTISYWFTRVVYERDQWDERLENWSQGIDIRIGWVFYLTRFSVWLTRKILWVLMMMGHAVSGYMLRQMEFDADRHEAHLAGSKTFARTARRLAILNVANQGALSDLGSFYSEGRLGDNLPRLIMINAEQLPKRVSDKIDEAIARSKTGILDTHPADSERIASAEKEQTAGIFRVPGPAAVLFRRFDFHSRAVTWDFYKEIFGKDLKKEEIHSVDELVERQKQQLESFKALRRFFQGDWSWYRPFPTPSAARTMPADVKQTVGKLRSARETMLKKIVAWQVAFKKFDDADTRLIETTLASKLTKAGVRVRASDFSISLTSRNEIVTAETSARNLQDEAEGRMVPFEQAASARLYAGLQLARTPSMKARLGELGILLSEIDQLLTMFAHVNERLGQLLDIRDGQITLQRLLVLLSENSGKEPLVNEVKAQMADLYGHISDLRESVESLKYPFDHARSDITLAEYLLKELPDEEEPIQILEAADAIGGALTQLQIRVLGRLCQIAEHVEDIIGFSRLDDPPEPEDDDDDDDE